MGAENFGENFCEHNEREREREGMREKEYAVISGGERKERKEREVFVYLRERESCERCLMLGFGYLG